MPVQCANCGTTVICIAGELANWFARCNFWDCPNCGEVTIFPIEDCLTFVNYCWRN